MTDDRTTAAGGGSPGPLGIVQDIERHGEAAPAETTFDWADEKVIEQLKARLNSDKR